jgi:hypothetical protein
MLLLFISLSTQSGNFWIHPRMSRPPHPPWSEYPNNTSCVTFRYIVAFYAQRLSLMFTLFGYLWLSIQYFRIFHVRETSASNSQAQIARQLRRSTTHFPAPLCVTPIILVLFPAVWNFMDPPRNVSSLGHGRGTRMRCNVTSVLYSKLIQNKSTPVPKHHVMKPLQVGWRSRSKHS